MDKKDKRTIEDRKVTKHEDKHTGHKKGEHRPSWAEVEEGAQVVNPDRESMDSRG